MSLESLTRLQRLSQRLTPMGMRGQVTGAVGALLEAEVPGASIGGMCELDDGTLCEVVGVKGHTAFLVPLEETSELRAGTHVRMLQSQLSVTVGDGLVGRILDGLGKPLDDGQAPIRGHSTLIMRNAPSPFERGTIHLPLATGVRAIDSMLTLGRGQRIALLAGSGVGKSTLMAMLARNVNVDVTVICLVGERGREVQEFVHDTLGEEGRKRACLVVATSDRSPALQVRSVFMATRIAEHFRAEGKHVLLLVDSITRLALAQRQIGLASGEPPTARGYTPSVFAMLPKLLERAGAHRDGGSITGVYTTLVEGDDIHDPIADAVRGIVDGHVVLSRDLANRGHFPAIDILQSISRLFTKVTDDEHRGLAGDLREIMAVWAEHEELVRLGAYAHGSDPLVDRAIRLQPAIRKFLRQGPEDVLTIPQTVQALYEVLNQPDSP
ncbi:MAG: flagellum-specific ATP synthase [Myxococcota bacterium]|jgi:flagellum-specific ATP synthase